MSSLGGSPPSGNVSIPPRTGSFLAARAPPAVAAPLAELLDGLPAGPSAWLAPQAATSRPPAPPTPAPPSSRRRLPAVLLRLNAPCADMVPSPPDARSHSRSSTLPRTDRRTRHSCAARKAFQRSTIAKPL